MCLKRRGDLIRYVMSRDDIASCAEETFPFQINSTIIDPNHHLIYLLPFEKRSIFIYKILDTNPSIQLLKEIHQDDDQQNKDLHLSHLALSPNQIYLVTLSSDQSMDLYENKERLRHLAKVICLFIDEEKNFNDDFSYKFLTIVH